MKRDNKSPDAHSGKHRPSSGRIKTAAVLFIILGIFLLPLLQVSFSEDISAMIPQGKNGRIAEDFRLLQKAPLSGSVLISIFSPDADQTQLARVAETLSSMLNKKFLTLQSYDRISPQQIISFLLSNSPNLTTKHDLEKLRKQTTDDSISSSLSSIKKQLLSPTGIGMKRIFSSDPLNLRAIYLRKLAPLKGLPSFNFTDRYVLNKDKSAVLLIARTDIPMTDSASGAALLEHFNEVRSRTLSEYRNEIPDLDIIMLSGHLYTGANARTIKRDIFTVSAISICALLLLFAAAFRNKEALSVFIAPGVAILAGMGSAALVFHNLSTIVIGFGAVLMGISIDFAVHTWFALSEHPQDRSGALRRVRPPVLFGAATSCAAFAALFISGIPGIRQLAVFSICGIIASCTYALIFIPAFCRSFSAPIRGTGKHAPRKGSTTMAAALSMIILAVSITAAISNSFDTELKNLGCISDSIRKSEKHFHEKWGDLRGQSLLFAVGKDEQEALRNNEKIWVDLNKNMPAAKTISIAPLMPSIESQQANRSRWNSFWTPGRVNATMDKVERAATNLGFAPKVFLHSIRDMDSKTPLLNMMELRNSPLAFLEDIFIPRQNGAKRLILTLLPDNSTVTAYFTGQKEKQLGARLVSQSRFKAALEHEMQADIFRFISLSGVLVLLLSGLLFRNLRRALLAVFPALFGTVTTFGLLGMLSIPLNIFHIVALPLVIGLGADYGIFMVFQEIRLPSAATVRAVKISGLTTLAGFGVLVFAGHPSLHALGTTVATGVSAALFCAIFILPYFLHLKKI